MASDRTRGIRDQPRALAEKASAHPERAFYVREIAAAAGTGASQVQKELELLTRAGLLLREHRANQVYFRANPDAPIFPELKGIIAKTFGIAEIVREALAPLEAKILDYVSKLTPIRRARAT